MVTRNTMKVSIALNLLVLALTLPAHAQVKNAPASPPAADKVDISDLESKYWAPKDTDFSVVQNRTYSKENKLFFTPQWGKAVNDPYSEGNISGLTFNYFWSERMGVQLMGFQADLQDNASAHDIQNLGSGAMIDHGKLKEYYGSGFNIVPFYAKMSFWGKRIIYFDMAFTPTIGVTKYEQQLRTMPDRKKWAFTYGLDITQYFFFSSNLAVRADLKNQFHSEEIVSAADNINQGKKLRDKTTYDTLFLLGLTFFF